MVRNGPVRGWYRSSRCSSESACVEVALLDDDEVGIRDSKLPASSAYLTVGRQAWTAFVHDVKVGRLDRP
jgi:hypothetical protein